MCWTIWSDSNIYNIYDLCLTVTDGDYYRLLIDGAYMLKVTAPGYQPYVKCHLVENIDGTTAEDVNFSLVPLNYEQPDDYVDYERCQLLIYNFGSVNEQVKETNLYPTRQVLLGH